MEKYFWFLVHFPLTWKNADAKASTGTVRKESTETLLTLLLCILNIQIWGSEPPAFSSMVQLWASPARRAPYCLPPSFLSSWATTEYDSSANSKQERQVFHLTSLLDFSCPRKHRKCTNGYRSTLVTCSRTAQNSTVSADDQPGLGAAQSLNPMIQKQNKAKKPASFPSGARLLSTQSNWSSNITWCRGGRWDDHRVTPSGRRTGLSGLQQQGTQARTRALSLASRDEVSKARSSI